MTRFTARRRLATAPVLVAVALTALVTGCGIGVDDAPRAIEDAATTTTTAVSPSSGLFSAALYFVREGTLIPVNQELPDERLDTKVAALLQAPTSATRTNGLSTSIPAGTELRSVTRREGRATVDLSSGFDNVVGLSRQQAIGQMVLTITGDSRIDTVEFQVEGEPITVSSPDRGDRVEVNACDFVGLLATPEQAIEARMPIGSIQVLVDRRAQLAEQCDGTTSGG